MTEIRMQMMTWLAALLIFTPGGATLAQFRSVQPLSPIPQAKIFFVAGAVELSDDAKMVLEAEAKALLVHPKYKVIVYGHADPFETGSRQAAWDLGLKRALAAMTYLIAQGVPAERLRPDSRGYEYLILSHDTPATRAGMRIVTIEVQLPEPHSNQLCYGMCG